MSDALIYLKVSALIKKLIIFFEVIFEGDILVTKPLLEEMEVGTTKSRDSIVRRNAMRGHTLRWKDGIVPYIIHPEYFKPGTAII